MKQALAAVLLWAGIAAAQTNTMQWQTTRAGNSQGECQLVSNSLRITVHPFYADVEEEAVIATRGGVWWGDPATLEIVGQFTVSEGTAVRSMLLWNGSKILKAKLKDRLAADSAYEQVVDRQQVQVVARDPAIIEYLGDNTYAYKIYPVAMDGSRRLRILYSVPVGIAGNRPVFTVLPVFTTGAAQTPSQIPVEIVQGETATGGYAMQIGQTMRTVRFGATYQISTASLFSAGGPVYDEFGYFNGWTESYCNPIRLIAQSDSVNAAYIACREEGRTEGNFAFVMASMPEAVGEAISELTPLEHNLTVEVTVAVGTKVHITDLSNERTVGVYLKSSQPWDSTVVWTVYGRDGSEKASVAQRFNPASGALCDSMLPMIWGARYSLVEETGNTGALFGFVDRQMSLLALESDTLSKSIASRYADAGVPALDAGDIVLKLSRFPTAPGENIMFDYGSAVVAQADALLAGLEVTVKDNGTISIRFGRRGHTAISVTLLTAAGRLVHAWQGRSVTGTGTELRLPAGLKGVYVVRVKAGDEVVSRRIVLR